jgi:hypothetical protein
MAAMNSALAAQHFHLTKPAGRAMPCRKPLAVFSLMLICFGSTLWAADSDHCFTCGKALGLTVYTTIDHVTHEKVFLCYQCATSPDECYICGLPAVANPVKLSDGRFLCARDAKDAVLDAARAREICDEIKEKLDRQFSRFLTLPSTNVVIALADRVDLYEEFAVTGNNFECPDVLGYIRSQTNRGGLTHSISIMTALPLPEFKATCAHEFMHAWLFEHASSARRKTLSRDAQEGFCELGAWLLMDSLHEEAQQAKMLRSSYTRGQIDLFIAAEKLYGLNDILDWMRWGVNDRLKAADLGDVRNVEMPSAKSSSPTNTVIYTITESPGPSTLALKGIFSAKNNPLALINNQSLAPGESARVRVGTNQVMVKCLSIGSRSVRIKIVDSGKELELQLPATR